MKNYLEDNYQNWYDSSVKAMQQKFAIPKHDSIEPEVILQDEYFGVDNAQS